MFILFVCVYLNGVSEQRNIASGDDDDFYAVGVDTAPSESIAHSPEVLTLDSSHRIQENVQDAKRMTLKIAVWRVIKSHGAALTENDLTLFNTIASTEGNRLESDYKQLSVGPNQDLVSALKEAQKLFHGGLASESITTLATEIKECKSGYVCRIMSPDAITFYRQDRWQIGIQILIIVCSTPTIQIFAWKGSKVGSFNKGFYSEPNADTLQRIVSGWFLEYLGTLFGCSEAPLRRKDGWRGDKEAQIYSLT